MGEVFLKTPAGSGFLFRNAGNLFWFPHFILIAATLTFK